MKDTEVRAIAKEEGLFVVNLGIDTSFATKEDKKAADMEFRFKSIICAAVSAEAVKELREWISKHT